MLPTTHTGRRFNGLRLCSAATDNNLDELADTLASGVTDRAILAAFRCALFHGSMAAALYLDRKHEEVIYCGKVEKMGSAKWPYASYSYNHIQAFLKNEQNQRRLGQFLYWSERWGEMFLCPSDLSIYYHVTKKWDDGSQVKAALNKYINLGIEDLAFTLPKEPTIKFEDLSVLEMFVRYTLDEKHAATSPYFQRISSWGSFEIWRSKNEPWKLLPGFVTRQACLRRFFPNKYTPLPERPVFPHQKPESLVDK